MAENDSLLGKTGDALQGWFRTLMMVLRDRRALLTEAPARRDPPLSPTAFMLGGAAAVYVVQNVVAPKAPDMELPPAISLLHQAVSAMGNITSVAVVVGAVISASVIWALFRIFRLKLSWQAAMRQASYNTGAQCVTLLGFAVPELIMRVTGHPASVVVSLAGMLGWLLGYLLLLGWVFRQYADECRVRKLRALPPFLLAMLPLWALAAVVVDAGPETWVAGVYFMAPAIEPGDLVHVDRWILAGRDPRPGEVVTIRARDAGHPWVPFGGAVQTALHPFSARVIAVPCDAVAAREGDLIVNGEALPREKLRLRPHDAADGVSRFRQRIGERSFVVVFGPLEAPKPCLAETPTELPPDSFLLAWDQRLDGNLFCALFPRTRFTGLIDWNLRSNTQP